jgi:hypothetical protein
MNSPGREGGKRVESDPNKRGRIDGSVDGRASDR